MVYELLIEANSVKCPRCSLIDGIELRPTDSSVWVGIMSCFKCKYKEQILTDKVFCKYKKGDLNEEF